jgi:hypothetical protein
VQEIADTSLLPTIRPRCSELDNRRPGRRLRAKKQIKRTAEGLDAAKQFAEEFNEAKRRPGRLQAERIRFTEAAARYLVAYKTKRDGTPRMLLSRAVVTRLVTQIGTRSSRQIDVKTRLTA